MLSIISVKVVSGSLSVNSYGEGSSYFIVIEVVVK